MAISGESFGPSARKSMFLHLKHGQKFDRAVNFTNLYLLMAKIALVLLNFGLMWFLMYFAFGDYDRVSSLFGPGLFVTSITWITCDLFIGIFDHITQTLLLCYTIDVDTNQK